MAMKQPVLAFLFGFAGIIFLVHSHKIRHAQVKSSRESPTVFSQKQISPKLKEIAKHSSEYSVNPDSTSEEDLYSSATSGSPDYEAVDDVEGTDSTRKYAEPFEGSADSNDTGNVSAATHKELGENAKCKACKEFENAKAFAIETIKAKILKKLQLTHLPNVSGTSLPKIPHLQKIIDKYNLQSDMPYMQDQWERGHHYYDNPEDPARTEKMFALGTRLPDYLTYINSSKACFFNVDPGPNIIKKGKLWVYLRPSKTLQNTVTYLRVYKLGPPPHLGMPPMRSLARSKKILLERAGGWHPFRPGQHHRPMGPRPAQ
ncbi:uncharacterized protein LOC135477465 [Liolophura sinensis]|uniref:uncharacterized protein LOC135477465 n=1 Tax=Liolophura sinensis TaxID=3198878 RepID=UPI0031598D9B